MLHLLFTQIIADSIFIAADAFEDVFYGPPSDDPVLDVPAAP